MNITNCLISGVYESLANWDDESQRLTMLACATGIAVTGIFLIERSLERKVIRLRDQWLDGLDEWPDDFLKAQKELIFTNRCKYGVLACATVTSAVLAQKYCAKGCPGFDSWAAIKNQFRQLSDAVYTNRRWLWTSRVPVLQVDAMAPYSTNFGTNYTS